MRLASLIAPLPGIGLLSGGNAEVTGITADSRQAGPGMIFAALPGTKADGRAFIADAHKRGAAAVLSLPDAAVPEGMAALAAADPRLALAQIAAAFFPRQPEHLVAVTGTNGKTSTVGFYRQIWERLGQQAASLGTLGCSAPGFADVPPLTTPDPVALHKVLDRLASEGFAHVAMEASSHGLDQRRLDGTRLAAGAFTNLTQDHLDYHGDMDTYRASKLRLFEALLPEGAAAVVNADSPEAEAIAAICRRRALRFVTYGAAGHSLRLVRRQPTPAGQLLDLAVLGHPTTVELPLAGAFQAANALAALGLALATGADPEAAVQALARLDGVPGRLQTVGMTLSGAPVLVDYAHTPDALETVLTALRPHVERRLVVVFGCGGDRDRGKRPIMGAIAARLAERAIITDDNPRSEQPAAIRAAILEGARGAGSACDIVEIGDRAAAIAMAVDSLQAGDVLVIAGKGHETGQIVGPEILPFDDGAVARMALLRAGGTIRG